MGARRVQVSQRRQHRADGTMGLVAAVTLTVASIVRRKLRDAPQGARVWAQAGPGRRLLFQTSDDASSLGRNCTPPGIHEFPSDVFTQEERQNGALLLHVFCAVYMFHALAIVCDHYFVPSLGKICKEVPLTWWCLFRDSVSYIISVLVLILVIHDEKVFWWEALSMALLYVAYIIVMKYNMRIRCYFEGLRCTGQGHSGGEQPGAQRGGSNRNDTLTVAIQQSGPRARDSSVLMVDELFSASPHKLSFSEVSLRIMITRHFRPRTRLCMASHMLINERQRHMGTRASDPEPHISIHIPEKEPVQNGTGASSEAERNQGAGARESEEAGAGIPGEPEEEEGKAEADSGGPLLPFKIPANGAVFVPGQCPWGRCEAARWLLAWPLSFLLYHTVPNCALPRWEKWFLVTFLNSTLWIGVFSYVMVWMVTIIGYSLEIPDVIMGITFLAAGTSVPDCMASFIVARQGMGDMAVSNSLGSNVFDILLGLGAPWILRTLVLDYSSVVVINSKGIVYSVILLLASVSLMVLGIHLNGWKLDRRLGVGALLLYAVFLCFSILIELNVFLRVNLPSCQ
ncbi:sodium/potassium/calcium exchanger 3-like [Stegostoma tigrinum]|uniref:sodium/potassium/calcium exchanger 3-like n=1 Tax=Stegostoma tigrinum TaxID=3053191 RepID=UPI0028705992|nr:sodium/potassium/calcium exchanger 3-like [Stegostoma tigrinum]